jgi:hypothetical protein
MRFKNIRHQLDGRAITEIQTTLLMARAKYYFINDFLEITKICANIL